MDLFTNAYNITPAGTTGWQTVGIGSYVPSNASVAVIRAINAHATTAIEVGAKSPAGSTTLFDAIKPGQVTLHSGIDGSQQVSLYRGSTDVSYYLLGYFTSDEGVVFNPYYGKSLTVLNTWTNLACAEVADGATYVILEINNQAATNYDLNFRAKGSTSVIQPTDNIGHLDFVVPLDSLKEIQYYVGGIHTCYIKGYIKYGTPRTDALEITSVTTTGAWTQPTEQLTDAPATAKGVIILVTGDGTYPSFGLRKLGSTDNLYEETYYTNGFHIIGLDNDRRFEIKKSSSAANFYIMGYVNPYTITGTSSVGLPSLIASATGITSIIGTAIIALPSLTAIAYGPIWGSGEVSIPVLTASATGTAGHYGKFSNDAKRCSIFIDAGGVFKANGLLPIIFIEEEPYDYGTFRNDAKRFYLSITDLPGTIDSISLALPRHILNISGYSDSTGTFISNALKVSLHILEKRPKGCVVINLANRSITEYSNYEFTSFARHGDKILATGAGGVYLLEGDTDNGTPISSYIKTVKDDFGSSSLKNVSDCYVGFKGGNLTVQASYDGVSGSRQGVGMANKFSNKKANLSKGESGRYFELKLSNVNGSDFDIDTIELNVHPKKGRI